MSAYEDLHVSLPAASRLIGAHGAAYLICAMLGCLVAFLVFESRAALLVTAWWCLTMVIVRSDLDDFIIPNWATAGIVLSGICFTLATTLGAFVHLSAMEVITAPIERGIITFVCVAAFGWAFSLMIGRECLGFGDVKLSGALALWLHAYDLIVTLELASVSALGLVMVYRLRNGRTLDNSIVPFGAFLAPAAWVVFVCKNVDVATGPWHALFR